MPSIPRFAATLAGSLPKPAWLAEPEKLWPQWRLTGADLDQGKRDAALIWLKIQEDAGIDIVTDGEQFRMHFVHGFLEHVGGIDWAKKTKMGIRNNRYVVDVPTVTGAIERKRSVHKAEAEFMRANTKKALKFTLPGPMTICDTIADNHYGRRADLAMAFAKILNAEAKELEAAGVDVIQFDEPAFNVFMDDVKTLGGGGTRCRLRRPQVHHRRAHLLRLWHRGQQQLEDHAWRGVAPVRGDISGTEQKPRAAGVAGASGLESAAVVDPPSRATRPFWSVRSMWRRTRSKRRRRLPPCCAKRCSMRMLSASRPAPTAARALVA